LLCCVGLNTSVCWKFPQRSARIILKTGSQLSFWRDHSARPDSTQLNSVVEFWKFQNSATGGKLFEVRQLSWVASGAMIRP